MTAARLSLSYFAEPIELESADRVDYKQIKRHQHSSLSKKRLSHPNYLDNLKKQKNKFDYF